MADRFWVGGTGNWTDTAHWSASSGGAGGASVPTNADNAIFNTLSNAVGYTVTINGAATCLSLTFGAPASGTITWAGSSTLAITGNFTALSGMTRTYTGGITFNSTSTGRTIQMNGVTLASAIIFNGSGGGWTLQDAFTTTGNLTVTAGTLNTNGVAVSVADFNLNGTSTLTLGASTVTCTDDWVAQSTATLNANTSTILLTATSLPQFDGGGLTYNNVTFSGVAANSTVTINGANSYNNLTFTAAATGMRLVSISANQTITGTLTVNPASANQRFCLQSSVEGTSRTITAAAVSLTDADFKDIAAAGAAAPFTGTRIGDWKGNSGITFTAGATKYWVGSGGSFTDADWALSSGGAGSVNNIPLAQDNVVFDANSFSVNGSITFSTNFGCGSMDFTTVDQTVTLQPSTGFRCFGDLTLSANVIWDPTIGDFTFSGRNTQTITIGGANLQNASFRVTSVGGTVLLNGDFITNVADSTFIQLNNGTLDLNDFDVSVSDFSLSGTATRALLMRSGTIEVTNDATCWDAGTVTNLTLTPGTSTIKVAAPVGQNNVKTFSGGGLTYNNIWLTGGGTGSYDFVGSNTFNDFRLDDVRPRTIRFTAGTTTTVTTFTVEGTAGNLITIGSITAANHNLVKAGGGVVGADYLSISRSQASPALTWYAGTNSTDGGNNSGWIFTDPVSGNGNMAPVGVLRFGLGMRS